MSTRRSGALEDTPLSAVQLKKDDPDFARLRVTDRRAVIVKSVPVDFNRIKVPLTCSVNAAAGFNWQGASLQPCGLALRLQMSLETNQSVNCIGNAAQFSGCQNTVIACWIGTSEMVAIATHDFGCSKSM